MRRRAHFPILALLAAALFLRALVPAGWMPAPDHGVFAVEPCPAADPATMAGMADHHGSSHKDHQGDDACFSALLIGFAPTDATPTIVSASTMAETPLAHPAIAALPTGPPAPPPPATGPPQIA